MFGTALHNAAKRNDTARMAILLEAGADVDARDELGNAPLHLASVRGGKSSGATRLLLDAGADPNAGDSAGHTALHYAALRYENRKNINALLAGGADANTRARNGNTPLHYAAAYGRDLAISFLLENGADPNVHNRANETPLHYLAARWRVDDDPALAGLALFGAAGTGLALSGGRLARQTGLAMTLLSGCCPRARREGTRTQTPQQRPSAHARRRRRNRPQRPGPDPCDARHAT